MKNIEVGTTYTASVVVSEEALAKTVGSGDVSVYATPMMVALMERAAASCLKTFLEEGETSVGTMIQTTHQAATPMEMTVEATATITAAEGRKVTFSIVAKDEKEIIGEALHERVILVKEKFEARAQAKR